MNSFEVIQKYLPRAVDKYFVEDSKTAILENGSKFIDVNFNETGYVKIASMLMDGLSDYYKVQEADYSANGAGYSNYEGNVAAGSRSGFQVGGMDVTWEIYKLQYCRGKQFQIDYISNEETAQIIIGAAIEEFHRVKVIPEVDASRFSLIADTTSATLGNRLVETVGTEITDKDDSTGIIHRFNAGFEWLTQHEVPSEMQILFVSPEVMTLIRNTKELYKRITQDDYKNGNGVTFTIDKYEGRPIIEVQSSRFFTDILMTQNGYRASSASKAINYMICSAKAVVPIRKIEYSNLFGPEMVTTFHGYIFNYQLYHGVVIPKNKLVGCYVSVSSTAAAAVSTNVLNVDLREGVSSNGWKLNAFFTMPAGLRGTVVYAETAYTVGNQIALDSANKIAVNEEKIDTSKTSYYFALVDSKGVVIAATKDAITLPKKA